ncbi:hypothetical protein PV327_004085 [Microctonus hyperodae]|uniref:Uncharacterized protein n=1 Tax=Microctonus hyperodae TaxID=165561 RepID=A0AA39FBN8_MICHY|nr:hypothetical protein PV327_004085 [Microctonus hyperodae]
MDKTFTAPDGKIPIFRKLLNRHTKTGQITDNAFIEKAQSIQAFLLDKERKQRNAMLIAATLGPLQNVVSKIMCYKLIESSITYDNLIEIFIDKDEPGVTVLLSKLIDGKPQVTKDLRILNSIVYFLESIINVIN